MLAGPSRVRVQGLSWACANPDENVDLDASCTLYDDQGEEVEAVHFARLASSNGSVRHTGDVVSNMADGDDGGDDSDEDDESIIVQLDKVRGVVACALSRAHHACCVRAQVPEEVEVIVMMVNNYTGNFKMVDTAKVCARPRFGLPAARAAHPGAASPARFASWSWSMTP